MHAKPRRWYQLRLRSLLLVMLLAACAAWVVSERRRQLEFERQQRAVLERFSSWMSKPIPADAVELDLYGCEAGVTHQVVYLPRLARLSLGLHPFDEHDLRPLARLPALKALEIRNAKLTPQAFAELGKLTRLTRLDLRGTPVDSQALEQVARLSRLETLVLDPPKDRAAWQHLAQLQQLKCLRIIAGGTLRPGDLRFLAQLRQLRLFWLQSSVEAGALAELEHVPLLTELRLQANQLKDSDLQHIAGHTRLTHLTLESNSGNYVTDEGLAVVANFPELSFLNVSHCRAISDRGLVHLQGLTRLRTLRLSRTSITDEGLANLTGLSRLVNLHVDGTKVTPAGLSQLGPRPALQTLKIECERESVPSELRLQFANAAIN